MNSLAFHRGIATEARARPPLDALSRLFLALGRDYNTNSNQVLVAQGDLDFARLRDAVIRAVRRFEHVRVRLDATPGPWAAEEVPVREVRFAGRCSLQDAAFRDFLMELSHAHRIDWRRQPATQVFLVRSGDQRTSCMYLNSAHAAADAASDCMLVEEILAQYRSPRPVSPAPAYQPLQDAAAPWPWWRGPGRRWAAAWRDIAASNVSTDLRLALSGSGRWGYAPGEAVAAFHTSVLPAGCMHSVRRASRVHGVSINTIFAAALVRLMATGARAPGRRHCRFSIAVSLRSRLGHDVRHEPFGNHVVTCNVRARDHANAVSLVRSLQQSVDRVVPGRLALEVGRIELALPLLSLRALQPVVRRAMARAQATNVCYSNPGVIRQDLSGFGPAHPVLEYTGLGALVSPFDVMLYTTTLGERTQLDVLYRRACFGSVEHELLSPYRAQLTRLVCELLQGESAWPPGKEWFA